MGDQRRSADAVQDAFEAYYRQQATTVARYGGQTREHVPTTTRASAHPQHYDESGFPVGEDEMGFTERIRRLLRP